MRKFVLFALLLFGGQEAKAQLNPLQGHGLPTTPTSGCVSPYTDLDTGTFYTCAKGVYTAGGNPSLVNNVIQWDGVKYPFTNAGIAAAITAAQALAGGGQGAAIHCPNTGPNGITLTGTVTMKSEVSIVGDSPDSCTISSPVTGSTGVFDWPAGTVAADLINIKVEQTGNSGTPYCFSFEAASGSPTYQNHIQTATCGTEQTNNLGRGIFLNPTPSGPSGAVFLTQNIFQDVYVSSGGQNINAAVISNGDYSNVFRNVVCKAIVAAGTCFQGTFINDRMDVHCVNEAATGAKCVGLTGNTNGDLGWMDCDLANASGSCASDANGGSAFFISDANLTPLGALPATDQIMFCTLNGSFVPFCPNGAAPTISSGFGTTPTVPNQNGPQSFSINVGTGGTATGGVIAMNETAINGWNCPGGLNQTAHAGNRADDTVQTASSTTTVTVQNQTKSTGVAVAWTANDILILVCYPR